MFMGYGRSAGDRSLAGSKRKKPMETSEPQHILVVEDDPTISEVVARYLQREGYEAEIALDGEEALSRAAEINPDLVVLDLMLPKIDGYEVCRMLRAKGAVPIIMLTARFG